MKYIIHLTLLSLITLLLSSCQKENVKEKIESYIEENNLDAQSTAEGLYYVIEESGSEEMPISTSEVTVNYQGMLTNGTIFDSSYDDEEKPIFPLNGNLIRGWKIGIPLFGKGGKGKLIIPPSLGYGGNGNNLIPPNSILVFDIELIDFTN